MGRESNEVSWTKEMPPTDLDSTDSKSHDDICSKNYCNISNGGDVQQLLLDDSKDPINNCDMGKEGNEVSWIEKMPPTNPNCTESKSHDDNYNSNHNGDRVGGKEQESDNLKSLEQFCNINYK